MSAHISLMSTNGSMPPFKRLYSLAQGLGLPVKFTESTTAPHPRPVFTVRASVGPFWAETQGPNKREVKTRACVMVTNIVETYQRNHSGAYGYSYTNSYAHLPPHCHPDFGLNKDPCTRLSELLMARKHPPAQYRLLEGAVTHTHWTFSIEVSVDQHTAVGKGGSKKEARRRAAATLLQMMGYTVPEEELIAPAPQTTAEPPSQTTGEPAPQTTGEPAPQTTGEPAPQTTGEPAPQITGEPAPQPENALEKQITAPPAHITPDFRLEKDPTTRLSELQMIRRQKVAEYRLVSGELVEGSWVFTVEVTLDQFTTSGSGRTKKEAKRNASTSLLLLMGFKVPDKDLPLEKPEEFTSEEHSEGQSSQTAPVGGECSETQTSGERFETLSNVTVSPEASQETPDQENQEESHIPQTTTETQDEEETEILETPDYVESPATGETGLTQQSPEEEELLCMFDKSSTDEESPENDQTPEQLDISSEEDLSPTEPHIQEDQTPENTEALMEVQNHLQTAEEANPEEVQLHTAENITIQEECEKLEIESPASIPEPPAAPQASQTLGSVESLVIHALVKKLLQKLPSQMKSHHDEVVQTLEKVRVQDQFNVPAEVHIKPRNIKKLGKAAARDLIHEYGSASKLLVMALGPDPTDFQKDAMKHLNFHLSAFRNRPRTVLARLFPQWDKPKKRVC